VLLVEEFRNSCRPPSVVETQTAGDYDRLGMWLRHWNKRYAMNFIGETIYKRASGEIITLSCVLGADGWWMKPAQDES
jgi:hypothetical protein